MPLFQFDCIPGGVVKVDCDVRVLNGKVDKYSLRMEYMGKPFDPDGLVIDYEDEFLPLREYLIGFAQRTWERR